MESQMKLTDLLRMSEVCITPNSQGENKSKAKTYSVLDSMDMKAYMEQLNSGKMGKEYHEVSNLRLSTMKYREYQTCGFVTGLVFNWSNGKSFTKQSVQGEMPNPLQEIEMNICQQLRKIIVKYSKAKIVQIKFLDENDEIIGIPMGHAYKDSIMWVRNHYGGGEHLKEDLHETVIDVQPGE